MRNLLLLASFAVLVSGCQLGNYTVTKRDSIEKLITAARADTEAKMTALKEQELAALRDKISTHAAREQSASDYLFKGSVAFGTLNPDKVSRPTLVMGQSIQQTAAQLPPATATAQAASLKALQTELDETRISTQVLIAQYEKELGIAKAEGAAKAQALTVLDAKIKDVEKEKQKVLGNALTKEQELQKAKDVIRDKDLAKTQQELKDAESVKAIKVRLSSIVGAIALLCLAGAIWSPVFKEKFGIGAAVLGLAAIGIWYVEGWMVALAVGIVIAVIVAWAAKNHYIESKTATNVYRAVQSFKETASDEYDKLLKPKLAEWQTKYTKDGDTIPDAAAIAHVDEVLKKAGDL